MMIDAGDAFSLPAERQLVGALITDSVGTFVILEQGAHESRLLLFGETRSCLQLTEVTGA